jgi:hypothetical protein
MNIKILYHIHKKLGLVRPVYFLFASFLFLGLAVYGLRQNNFKMIELREAVVVADQKNGNVEGALRKLRAHVHGHMNTNLASGDFAIRPPIQLKARYDRLVAAEQPRVNAKNAEIAKKGEAVCAAKHPAAGFNAPRVACVQDYVAQNAVKPNSIPDDLYKFDFVSPHWSPDLAGWSLVAAGLLFLLFVSRLAVEKWLRDRLA